MGDATNISVTVEGRERIALCALLLNAEVKGELDRRRWNRLFGALALDAIADRAPGTDVLSIAAEEVSLTAENITYLRATVDATTLTGAGARLLGRLLDRIDSIRGPKA